MPKKEGEEFQFSPHTRCDDLPLLLLRRIFRVRSSGMDAAMLLLLLLRETLALGGDDD